METKEFINKIRKYYLKGLTSKEIGKLLDLSPRTVQRYMKEYNIKETKEPKTQEQRALELVKRGFSYSEVARRLRVCKSTVYLWNKKQKNSA